MRRLPEPRVSSNARVKGEVGVFPPVSDHDSEAQPRLVSRRASRACAGNRGRPALGFPLTNFGFCCELPRPVLGLPPETGIISPFPARFAPFAAPGGTVSSAYVFPDDDGQIR